jgi:hypothetical protein
MVDRCEFEGVSQATNNKTVMAMNITWNAVSTNSLADWWRRFALTADAIALILARGALSNIPASGTRPVQYAALLAPKATKVPYRMRVGKIMDL